MLLSRWFLKVLIIPQQNYLGKLKKKFWAWCLEIMIQWTKGCVFLHHSPRWSSPEPSMATTACNLMFINSTHLFVVLALGWAPVQAFGCAVGIHMEMARQKLCTAELTRSLLRRLLLLFSCFPSARKCAHIPYAPGMVATYFQQEIFLRLVPRFKKEKFLTWRKMICCNCCLKLRNSSLSFLGGTLELGSVPSWHSYEFTQ